MTRGEGDSGDAPVGVLGVDPGTMRICASDEGFGTGRRAGSLRLVGIRRHYKGGPATVM